MRRVDSLMRIATLSVVTLPILLAGCARNDSMPGSNSVAAVDHSSVVDSNNLPEVVITAQRLHPSSLELAEREASSRSR
jgi:hypothetical protein